MGKELEKVLDIPEGIEVVLKDNDISVNGPNGVIHRELWYPGIVIDQKDNTIIINLTINRKKTAGNGWDYCFSYPEYDRWCS